MYKHFPAVVMSIIPAVSCAPAAQAQVPKKCKEQRGIIIVDTEYVAKITGIKGNTLVLKNYKGEVRKVDAASVAGITVGTAAKCEGKDCTTLRIGHKPIKVKEVK